MRNPLTLTVPVVHENLEIYEVLIAPLNPPIFTMFGVHMISIYGHLRELLMHGPKRVPVCLLFGPLHHQRVIEGPRYLGNQRISLAENLSHRDL